MKVKELIEILKSHDPELEILLSSDPEGNAYHSFDGKIYVDTFIQNKYEFDRCDDADEYLVFYP